MTNVREYVHQSNLIEGFDDRLMDLCGEAAWYWLRTHDVITREVLLDLHRLVVIAQDFGWDYDTSWVGSLRTEGVRVGRWVAPSHRQVPRLVDEWLDLLRLAVVDGREGMDTPHGIATPRELHVRFEKIHPFMDGNGRTGRLLMWWHEERLGLTPRLIRFDERHEYYRWFKEPHQSQD